MTEKQARRVVLALMDHHQFGLVVDLNNTIRHGHDVQEHPGFTNDEVHQAVRDRSSITHRYQKLKQEYSFHKSAAIARAEFLASLDSPQE